MAMDTRLIRMILFFLLLLYRGMVSGETVTTLENQDATAQVTPVQQTSDVQAQLEQAADNFDAFALQVPAVVNAKLDSFLKHGFRAILLDDPETQLGEQQLIQSLSDGLRHLGTAFAYDMENYRNRQRSSANKGAGLVQPSYHPADVPAQK